jgi:serine/threonine-protein kinase
VQDVSSEKPSGQKEWSADELIPFGKYILLDRVSSGATAAVYRANVRGEAGFERLVAIKRILPHMAGDRDFVDTFVREAKTVAKLAHEGICPIYELGKVGESLYMAIEYIQGCDLGRITRRLAGREESMPPLIAAWIAARLCDALDYAHTLKNARGSRTGVIHRDISPSNIMLSFEGQVRLLDFGLAKAVGRAQSTNVDALKFKIGYMSPEMVKGRPLDARSDLFGVGVCLYEMLTGRRLFAGKNDIETIALVGKAQIPQPSAVMEDAPEELEQVILRALQREPDDRYQTAAEMAEALNTYIQHADPTFGPQRIVAFLRELFEQDIADEQARIRLLLAASNNPALIASRRTFFASATGAAARARAETEKQLARERGSVPPSVRVQVPPPAHIPEAVTVVGTGEFEDEPTGFYDPDPTKIVPDADSLGAGGFEDEPTQFLVDSDLAEMKLAEVPSSGGFDEEPTEIFFNKEDGQGMQSLYDEQNTSEPPQGPLNRPIIAPEFSRVSPAVPYQNVPSRPPRPNLSPAPPPSDAWNMPSVLGGFSPSVPPPAKRRPAMPWAAGGAVIVLLLAVGVVLATTPVGIRLGLRAAPTGAVEVRTTPSVNASIKLDGVFRGVAPLRLQGVRVGVRQLVLQAPGYLPIQREVTITDGSTTVLELALVSARPATPTPIAVAPSPAAAVPAPSPPDAAPVAPAPVVVPAPVAEPPPPAVAVAPTKPTVARKPRARPAAAPDSSDVAPATPTPTSTPTPAAAAPAARSGGSLSINTVPWAYVYIDGRDTKRNTPLLGFPVTTGPHDVRLQTPTGSAHVVHVEIAPGETVRISHRF